MLGFFFVSLFLFGIIIINHKALTFLADAAKSKVDQIKNVLNLEFSYNYRNSVLSVFYSFLEALVKAI